MFTGIVEEIGTVLSRKGPRLRIGAREVLEGVALGDSIAVNGVCLTVIDFDHIEMWWDCDVSEETYRRTNLEATQPGSRVNLERPVRASDRLGGHVVQGHVDAVGAVLDAAPDLRVSLPADLMVYVVEKGSITIEGVSLTVVETGPDWVTIALIPHTCEVTTLGNKVAGDPVNIEVDVTAKYVEKLVLAQLERINMGVGKGAQHA